MTTFKLLMMTAGADEMAQVYWMSTINRTVDASSDTSHQINSMTSDSSDYIYGMGQYGQVYKYDPSGGLVWNTRVRVIASNGTEYDLPGNLGKSSCHVDASGNVYVTGGLLNDVFVVKLNSSGNVLWYTPLTPSSDAARGNAITTDSSGNVYVAGRTRYVSNMFSTGARNLVFKLNSSGALQWARYFGAQTIIEEADGIAIDGSGNVIVSCFEYNTPGNRQDLFLLKYNSSGALQTNQAYGMDANPSRGDFNTFMALDSSDNRYTLSENSTDSTDYNVYLIKYNSSGTIQWQKKTVGSPAYEPRGIKVDSTGIYIAFVDNSSGNYIAHFDTSGNLQWQRSLSPASPYSTLYLYGLSLDSSSSVGICGRVVDSSTSYSYGLVGRLPGDGSLTGVYGGISYASAASPSWATPTGEAALISHSSSISNGNETLSAPAQGSLASQEQSIKYNIVE